VCARVWTEWKSVPYIVKEDAVDQALMAFSTNAAKRKKQQERRRRNAEVVVQSYTVKFRESSQSSVMSLPKGLVIQKFVKAEKKELHEEAAERVAAEGLARLGRAERVDQNSPNAKVHFFAEFSGRGAVRNMKVASDEVNAPVKYGIRLCDSKKITDQIFDKSKIAMTRLRFNPRTKEYFVDVIVKVPRTSEKKEGLNVIMGNDPGITPMDTVYIGSTGECFQEQIEGHGGRELLFKKAEKVQKLEEQLRKM